MKPTENVEFMDLLEEFGYGICYKCLKINEIERGDNFFYNNETNEWLCEKCERVRK